MTAASTAQGPEACLGERDEHWQRCSWTPHPRAAARSVLSASAVLCPRKLRLPRVSRRVRAVLFCPRAAPRHLCLRDPSPAGPLQKRCSDQAQWRVSCLAACAASPTTPRLHSPSASWAVGASKAPRPPQRRGHTTHPAGASWLLLGRHERVVVLVVPPRLGGFCHVPATQSAVSVPCLLHAGGLRDTVTGRDILCPLSSVPVEEADR